MIAGIGRGWGDTGRYLLGAHHHGHHYDAACASGAEEAVSREAAAQSINRYVRRHPERANPRLTPVTRREESAVRCVHLATLEVN